VEVNPLPQLVKIMSPFWPPVGRVPPTPKVTTTVVAVAVKEVLNAAFREVTPGAGEVNVAAASPTNPLKALAPVRVMVGYTNAAATVPAIHHCKLYTSPTTTLVSVRAVLVRVDWMMPFCVPVQDVPKGLAAVITFAPATTAKWDKPKRETAR
jgi:hypothetical protein